jgi:two-component system phosphate regulon sensor histidine kinase PhoR
MQLSVQREWSKRLDEFRKLVSARLSVRLSALGVAAALTAIFLLGGRLSWHHALLGLLAVAVWAALWPTREQTAITEAHAVIEPISTPDRLWRQVLDAAPDPAIALDSAGQVLHANTLAEQIFSAARRRGVHVASISRDPELLEAVDQALGEHSAFSVELQERVPVERRLHATVVALDRPAQGAPAVVIFLRDLTEQDRLTRMRADFVANASHELRTPLASLLGYVETLQGAAKDDPAARERFLNTMREQAERMSRLVDDLLSLSRVEMREYLPPTGQADLGSILADVLQTLEPLATRAGITLALSPEKEVMLVPGERDELMQVFQNLVQNAIKYGKSGGRVDVRLTRETQGGIPRCRVDVIDNGTGIAAQHLPRLTERFYRVNVAASREKGGTGLGLAIVKHILNRHRGELQVSSVLGEGSTFSVVLPAARTQLADGS